MASYAQQAYDSRWDRPLATRTVFASMLLASLLAGFGSPPPAVDAQALDDETAILGEVLVVQSTNGKIAQVRLRKPDGRFLRVELDATGARLGIKHSGQFAEVTGPIYLKEVYVPELGARLVRWIRVTRYRLVSRPPGWVDPPLECFEEEDIHDGPDLEEDRYVDAGAEGAD